MALEKSYEILLISVDQLRVNLNNPRNINPEKFQKLVQSIKDAPWMLKLRPIVIDEDSTILGGNQRFKACVEAGLTHVWTLQATDLSEEQKRRFILRDNIDFGKWDLEILRKQYTPGELLRYGAEIDLLESKPVKPDDSVQPPPPIGDDDFEPDVDENELEESKKNFNDNSIKQIVFQLPNDVYEDTLKTMDEISKTLDLDDNSDVLLHLINYYEVSNGLENTNHDSLEE